MTRYLLYIPAPHLPRLRAWLGTAQVICLRFPPVCMDSVATCPPGHTYRDWVSSGSLLGQVAITGLCIKHFWLFTFWACVGLQFLALLHWSGAV